MIIKKYESREEWLNDRLGKASGSRAKDVMPDSKGNWKKGFWELVDERLRGAAAINSDENAMDRGHRLEPEALARFSKETGKKIDNSLQTWTREDDTSIMVSPDGVIGKKGTEAIEVKCLVGPSHAEALYTNGIPKNTAGYLEQALHYFVVNDALKTLHFVFYNPDYPPGLDYFCLIFTRKEYKDDIASQLSTMRQTLQQVRDVTNKLSERIKIPDNFYSKSPAQVVAPIIAIENKKNSQALDEMFSSIKEHAYD